MFNYFTVTTYNTLNYGKMWTLSLSVCLINLTQMNFFDINAKDNAMIICVKQIMNLYLKVCGKLTMHIV